MEQMTREEMVRFLQGMENRRQYLEQEKERVKKSVESLEEAIQRNSFRQTGDESSVIAGSFKLPV